MKQGSRAEWARGSLVVVDLVQDGAHEHTHDGSEDEARAIVGAVTPVADPELPEDHPELGEVVLGVLVLEAEGLNPLLGDAQLLDQLLVLPEHQKHQSHDRTHHLATVSKG